MASSSDMAMFCEMTRRARRASDSRNGNVPQVVVHQRDAGGVGGDVGARQAHGHADIGGGQNRTVVDAVADDQRAMWP